MRAYVCVCLFSKLFSIGKHNKLFELRWEWNNFDSQQHAEKFEKSYLRIRTNRYAFIFFPLQMLSLYYTWHKMDGKMTNKINTQKPLVFLSIYNNDNGTEKRMCWVWCVTSSTVLHHIHMNILHSFFFIAK